MCVVTPIISGERQSEADARLVAFLEQAMPNLGGYVPGAWEVVENQITSG